MEEYKSKGNWYDVAPGVAYLDDSKSGLGYSGDKPQKVGALEIPRLMQNRGVQSGRINQQEELMLRARAMGYKMNKAIDAGPYDSDRRQEDMIKGKWASVPKGISFEFGSSGGKSFGGYATSSGIGPSYAGKS